MSKRSMIEKLRDIENDLRDMRQEATELEEYVDCPPGLISTLLNTAANATEEARTWLQYE